MTKRKDNPKPAIRHSNFKVHWIMKFAREERVRQGLSQEELSSKMAFASKHLCNYETGFYTVRALYALERILGALGYHLKIHRTLRHERKM